MCDGKLLFMAGGQSVPVINYPTGAFETSKQIDLGNSICAALSLIPDWCHVFYYGGSLNNDSDAATEFLGLHIELTL